MLILYGSICIIIRIYLYYYIIIIMPSSKLFVFAKLYLYYYQNHLYCYVTLSWLAFSLNSENFFLLLSISTYKLQVKFEFLLLEVLYDVIYFCALTFLFFSQNNTPTSDLSSPPSRYYFSQVFLWNHLCTIICFFIVIVLLLMCLINL